MYVNMTNVKKRFYYYYYYYYYIKMIFTSTMFYLPSAGEGSFQGKYADFLQ